ncbi:hypothetical protein HYX16_02330 [Candidatus Woesearchaeota archaeon]|nr:hypothetical protein [Candidatus Woesearchaeota archaeon]
MLLSELSFDRKLCWYCGKKDAAEPFGMDSNLNLIYKFHSEKEYCRARSVFKAVRNKAKYPP